MRNANGHSRARRPASSYMATLSAASAMCTTDELRDGALVREGVYRRGRIEIVEDDVVISNVRRDLGVRFLSLGGEIASQR